MCRETQDQREGGGNQHSGWDEINVPFVKKIENIRNGLLRASESPVVLGAFHTGALAGLRSVLVS